MSKKDKISNIDEVLDTNDMIHNKSTEIVEDIKFKNPKLNKIDYQIENYKVLLAKRDGVVIDFNGKGIFIKTDEKISVGSFLKIKYKGVLGKSNFELV
jgi:hypothetical protein